ncbi:hypothetical protein EMIHUDRAFT_448959 [Emiliania huxleyi CCMP1516]|uniref:Uncharacterized protein n=2 Tax=Emiliania huxleyi TaxID=2903 RepID=A0A0D3KQJ7_EMIH1|nr:hypothetical protein EMIHUDRAFT_448959 [Emiliania huxleyi CCMP1516]EOD38032.1 hypothetical protein EMIHUDRAFT_448959 [Emiliania huxleyi CCMP1516]|eukprot:XP_005790461.1 hypothetical protein EMIHUDRAFT_448959 [Emiliania huxleyi CCMP1516]
MQAASTEFMWPTAWAWIRHPRVALDVAFQPSCESEAEDSPAARPLSAAVASAACDGAEAIGRTMLSCFGEHMIDYRLRGASFAAADAEWEAANKPGFRYGLGGKHMRSDAASSQLASAPDGHFLNRYCTSAIMEDKARTREKLHRIDSSPATLASGPTAAATLARARAELAEVWAALMCYALTLSTEPLRAKGRLLQKRAAELCPLLNDAWWESVYTAQATRQNLWERHASPDNGTIYHHYLTGEVRTEADPPEGWSIDSA